jgi:hypothetical protein
MIGLVDVIFVLNRAWSCCGLTAGDRTKRENILMLIFGYNLV